MATRKPAVATDEKFQNQDFDLFKAIDAVDAKNYDWFSELTDEQKKKFVPYMMTHWVSSVKKTGMVGAYYVRSVDANANKYLFNETINRDHPELQWKMLCASSPGIGKQFHSWIPHLNAKITKLREPATKKEVKDYFAKVYAGLKADVLEDVAASYTQSQRHQHNLAKMYPNMKLEDIEQLSKIVSEKDIEEYERDSGN
jgi:hypothetical protein